MDGTTRQRNVKKDEIKRSIPLSDIFWGKYYPILLITELIWKDLKIFFSDYQIKIYLWKNEELNRYIRGKYVISSK